MLDEMLLAGELQEPSKKAITRVIEVQVRLIVTMTVMMMMIMMIITTEIHH